MFEFQIHLELQMLPCWREENKENPGSKDETVWAVLPYIS